MVARRRRRAGVTPRQWLGWSLAALVVAGVAYVAVQRGLLKGADLRGAVPGGGQLCPATRAGGGYIYSDTVAGTGQSFFYWLAWRSARDQALGQITCAEPEFLKRVGQQLTCPVGCEKVGAPACRPLTVNVSDPSQPGRFGRLLARHTCQLVKAQRQPHPGWRWGQWTITVSCRRLCGCNLNQACVKEEPPVEAPDPEPQPPAQEPIINPPNEPAPDEDPTQPQPPAQEPVATFTPQPISPQDLFFGV